MKLLAIDTAATALSAAIVNEQGIIGEFALDTGKNHSVGLLPMLEALLANTGLALKDMDAFAVTQGPGSFTGLRIGIATVKAWGDALKKPLIGISTLDAVARAMGCSGYAAPVLDARRNEVYTAFYQDGKRLTEDMAIAPADLAEKLLSLNAPVAFAGDGVKPYEALFREKLGDSFCPVLPERRLILAPAAAMLGMEKLLRGETTPNQELLPVYLRLSEAEEKRLEAEGKQ